jgi:hypothetical protein
MVAFCSDTKELYLYNGSAWVGAKPRTFYNTATQAFTTTSFVDVTNLAFSVEINSLYKVSGLIHYSSTTSGNDLKTTWSGPASIGGFWVNGGPNTTFADGSAFSSQIYIGEVGWTSTITTGSSSTNPIGSRIEGFLTTGANSGSMQLRAALNTATGTLTFGAYCFIQALKVG